MVKTPSEKFIEQSYYYLATAPQYDLNLTETTFHIKSKMYVKTNNIQEDTGKSERNFVVSS